MAVTRIGFFQANGSAGDGSDTLIVPFDTTLAVAFWFHWDGNTSTTLSTLSLGGSAFTELQDLAEGATTDEYGGGVGYLENPPTGHRTLSWTWSAGGARSEGGSIVIVYVKGHKTGDIVRDSDVIAELSGVAASITIDSDTTDLVLGLGGCFSSGTPALTATVFINNAALNSTIYDVSDITPGAATTTIATGVDTTSNIVIGLSLKAGPDPTKPMFKGS